jgi:hypothetical protein
MPSKRSKEEKLRQMEDLARGWGKLLAGEAFGPDGPGLDVDLAAMEEIVAAACRGMTGGAVEAMTQKQAEAVGAEAACPGCGKLCAMESKGRRILVRGGPVVLEEPVGHCSACRRDFFPSAAGAEGRRSRL